MKCDIIIPVWNQLKFTRDCIASILKWTDIDYGVIVIDNAGNDETSLYLESLRRPENPSISIIRNEKNAGFVKAVNQGIASSDAGAFCVLNNDTVVTEGWLSEMMGVLNSSGDIGLVNPSSNTLGQRPLNGEPMELYAAKLKKESGKFVELGAAVGFCMLIKKEVISRIGLFDEIYGMGNFEDTDFSRRAVKEGYRCVRACGAYVYHRENLSFNRIKTFEEDFKRNREIFEFRWGRPKRVAYILDSYDDNTLKKLKADSLKLARGGNWVWCYSKGRLDLPPHSNIIPCELSSERFHLAALFRILKKKKKFNDIFVGEEKFGKLLEMLSFIHRAKIRYY